LCQKLVYCGQSREEGVVRVDVKVSKSHKGRILSLARSLFGISREAVSVRSIA
jgi:hypothetical protein